VKNALVVVPDRCLRRLPEVKDVNVQVVFDPPWNPGRMSEAAKLQLGFDLDYGSSGPSVGEFGGYRILR